MGMNKLDTKAHAAYDLREGSMIVSVELPVSPEKLFPVLTGQEVTRWWVNPGVFDTREWRADVRKGGNWSASGVGRGQPYVLQGEFVEVSPPKRLVHTWRSGGGAGKDSTVTYELEEVSGGTRLTLRHDGIREEATLVRTCKGWETSFDALVGLLCSGE